MLLLITNIKYTKKRLKKFVKSRKKIPKKVTHCFILHTVVSPVNNVCLKILRFQFDFFNFSIEKLKVILLICCNVASVSVLQ